MNIELELLKALQDISAGQKAIAEKLDKISSQPPGDLIPMKMPDGSVAMVPRSALQASTQGAQTGKITEIKSQPITTEPWPDPSIPKPKIVR